MKVATLQNFKTLSHRQKLIEIVEAIRDGIERGDAPSTPMPKNQFEAISSEDEMLNKIFAYIRSNAAENAPPEPVAR